MVQALRYECFPRQMDIIGKGWIAPASHVLKPSEIRRVKKVWRGMTIGMILDEEKCVGCQCRAGRRNTSNLSLNHQSSDGQAAPSDNFERPEAG